MTLTSEEVLEMAREAGNFKSHALPEPWIPFFEAFAKLVDAKATAREREACAKTLLDLPRTQWSNQTVSELAKVIRARSGTTSRGEAT